ncbi:hypothetical protein OROHE_009088 [Orobanche hederae]
MEQSSSKLKRTISRHHHVDVAETERNKKKSKIQKKKKKFDITNVNEGESVDLLGFLFTKKRNHLMNFKDNKKVKAEDLSGKVIALIFKSLDDEYRYWRSVLINLLDLHSKLHPAGGFEILFVAVQNQTHDYYQSLGSTPRNFFLDIVSTLPFPAFMMSDKESRVAGLFFRDSYIENMPISFIIDPQAAGYPFTNERIDFLDSEDNLARNHHPPSVERLLASPERDYLINNQGEQEPLRNLDDKVVGLFFCPSLVYNSLTIHLDEVYEELFENKKDFEIVFIYTHGWLGWFEGYYNHTDEDSFNEAFQTMPWLALPFKDTDCNKKLQRIFQYTHQLLGPKPDPMMVIIGPHGNFIEPMGMKILLSYGASAYPFSRVSAVNLELERAKELKLEKLWDLDSVFMKKNGTQVLFSQLVGKRIIVLSTGQLLLWDKLRALEAIYIKMKGTSDEFEVIQIHDMGDIPENAKTLPWLMYYSFDADSCPGNFIGLVPGGRYVRLVAFDRDGSLVRRTTITSFGNNMVFPFYPGGKIGDMKDEVLLELERIFEFRVKYICGTSLR